MRRLRRPAPLVLITATVVLASGACGSSDKNQSSTAIPRRSAPSGSTVTSAASTTSAAAGSDTIAIQNFKFNPESLPTKTGKITVINMDEGTPHSLTADDNSFDTGVFRKNDGPKTITLDKTGTFKYHCQVHPTFMHGTIQVS